MSITIRLPTPLRSAVGGASTVSVEAKTLSDLRAQISEKYPELAARVLRDGAFGQFVSVFVDGEDVRFLDADADLTDKRVVEILPAMSGGAVANVARPFASKSLRTVHGSFIDETIGIVARQTRDTVSFAVGAPAAQALALVNAGELLASVLEREGVTALSYGITEGEPDLREIIAAGVRADGIPADAEDVIVTAGALQAIDLVCRVMINPGDVVVVESPGFANALSAFRNYGARILEVPTDSDGLDVSRAARMLRESGARARLFFVVPNFQNPSGVTLSLERRRALLALAASHGATVVEDDPYIKLRYRGETLPPLASLSAGVPVISIGTFSKTFLPGLRVGWAIADSGVIAGMTAAKQTMDSSTSSLGQRMLVEFHRLGRFEAHEAALREMYQEKQQRARAALEREFSGTGVTWNDPDGGFYLWLKLPQGVNARKLLDAALVEGVAFVPGDAFSFDHDHSEALRFSYSSPIPERIDEGVVRLRRAFNQVTA